MEEQKSEIRFLVSREEISWEEARSLNGLGQYVPLETPEGYSPMEAKLGETSDAHHNLLLTWTDGTYALWLNLTETDLDVEMYEGGQPVYTVLEDWQSLIPEPGEDGSIQFALLYEDGVLIEYKGWLSKEEIVRLFSKE